MIYICAICHNQQLFKKSVKWKLITLHTGILMGLTGAFQDFSFEIQLNLEYLASNRLVRHQGGGGSREVCRFFSKLFLFTWSQMYFYYLSISVFFSYFFPPILFFPPLLLFGKIYTYAMPHTTIFIFISCVRLQKKTL